MSLIKHSREQWSQASQGSFAMCLPCPGLRCFNSRQDLAGKQHLEPVEHAHISFGKQVLEDTCASQQAATKAGNACCCQATMRSVKMIVNNQQSTWEECGCFGPGPSCCSSALFYLPYCNLLQITIRLACAILDISWQVHKGPESESLH